MKIEWLDSDCTEAVITRGWWRPKSAFVTRTDSSAYDARWKFSSGRLVAEYNWSLPNELEKRRIRELRVRADNRDWVDTSNLPKAALVVRRP